MNIKVIGMGCDKCDSLYENVRQAVSELGLCAEIEKVGDLVEIVRLGVLSAPSLMVDGKLVLVGQTASVKRIKELLTKG